MLKWMFMSDIGYATILMSENNIHLCAGVFLVLAGWYFRFMEVRK